MRYPKAHADSSGSVPFALRGPKAVRTVVSAAVAVAIGLTPALFYAAPASAAPGDITITPGTTTVAEGGTLSLTLNDISATGSYEVAVVADNGTHPATITANTDVSQPSTTVIADADLDLPLAFTVATTQDTLYEYDETFQIVVTDADDDSLVASRVVTITDDDSSQAPTYTLTATPASVTEAAGAKTTITATLNKASGRDTVVTVNTVDGTAIGGNDFTAQVSQTITINPSSLTGTLDINVTDDGFKDTAATENFTVVGNATNVASGASLSSIGVSIADAQANTTPKLTISGGDGTEGGNSTFTVTATPGSELPISAQWSSADTTPASGHGVATPGVDFTYPGTRTVTVDPRTTTSTIVVPLTTDTIDEPDEEYTVALASPTNAELGTPSKKTATITDNTNAPSILSIVPAAVDEGNDGKKVATFTATLSAASAKTVKAEWTTADGTAKAALDYVASSGSLTFTPGSVTQTIEVPIIGDTVDEGAGETFTVGASSTDGSLTAGAPVSVTITDDDAKPTVTFPDVSIMEGNETSAKLVPVKLSNASDNPISFTLADTPIGTTSDTLSNTIGSGDYELLNGTVTIPAGQTSGYAVVLVNGDTIYEPNEAVDLVATVSAGAGGADFILSGSPATGRLTLGNDDKAPDLEINSAKGEEGETVKVTGTVVGVSQDNTTLTVSFAGKAVDNHKAAGDTDFTNPGAQVVTLTPATLSGSVRTIANIPLVDDNVAEPDESIVGSGTGLGGVGTVTDGVIVIEANDGGGTTPEEPGEAPTPTISAPASVNGTGPVSITGKVAANATVELWGAPVAGGELKWIANTKAGTTGNYSFSRSISQGMRFVTQSQEINSAEVEVWVNQWASLTASSPSRGRVTVLVKTSPNAADRKVVVQRWTGPNTWTNILVSRANVNGAYTATTSAPRGLIALRAWVEGDADMGINGPGWSSIVRPVIK